MAGPLPMVKKMTPAKTSEMPTQTALQIAASLNLMMCAPRWASRSMVSMIRTTAPKAAQAQSGTVMAMSPCLVSGGRSRSQRLRPLHSADADAADPWQISTKNQLARIAEYRQ